MSDIEVPSGSDFEIELGSQLITDAFRLVDSSSNTLFEVRANGTIAGNAIKDEDNMSSDSDVHLATQQSIKAYVDGQVPDDASDLPTDTAGFDGILSASEDTVQKALDVIDDHASDHTTGGSGEIDGDKLDIDWNPSNYAPSTSPSEVDNLDNLTAHLKGIDDELGDKVDSTTGLTSDFPVNENGIIFDDSLSATAKYSGLIISAQTLKTGPGQTIAVGDLLFLNSLQQWELANATATSTMLCAGVSLGTCGDNTTNGDQKVLLQGFIRKSGYSFSIGSRTTTDICYPDTNDGAVTQSKPSSSGNVVQPIGWARSSDTMYFSPNWTYTIV